MAKTAKAPTGFYTARQAANRLGLKEGTFHSYVRSGKINKVVPPGGIEGYYPRIEIEKFAQERELFFLKYSIAPTTYERASTTDDIKGIVELCIAIYGIGGTPSLETRLEIWKKNPDAYYIVKQENIVVGYISLVQFNEEALNSLMGQSSKQQKATAAGKGVYSVTGAENTIALEEGKPIQSFFISVGVRPGLTNSQQRNYGFKLIRDTLDVLVDFAKRGMPVKKLLGTSETSDGIKLAHDLGMEETKYPNDPLLRFELDLEKSNSTWAKNYRSLLQIMDEKSA